MSPKKRKPASPDLADPPQFTIFTSNYQNACHEQPKETISVRDGVKNMITQAPKVPIDRF